MRTLLLSAVLAAMPLAAQAVEADLPGDRFFPEGIAAAPDGTLYVGSFYRGGVWKRPPDADAFAPFASADAGMASVIGVEVDPARGLLFACSSDLGLGAHAGEYLAGQPSSLFAFDLATGAVRGRWPLGPSSFCNDIALQPDGSVLATDSMTPTIYRLAPDLRDFGPWETDDRWHSDFIGLNGIVALGSDVYVVTYDTGRLFRIDADAAIHEVSLPRPLSLPDGLERLPDGDILVVEGTGALTRITLAGETAALTMLRDGLDQPTTVAAVTDGAWVLEGQIGTLADSGSPSLPFRAVWVPIP